MAIDCMALFMIDPQKIFPVPMQGTVIQMISAQRPGRIQFQASSWPAKLYQSHEHISLLEGQDVKVVGREGITLLVQPN